MSGALKYISPTGTGTFADASNLATPCTLDTYITGATGGSFFEARVLPGTYSFAATKTLPASALFPSAFKGADASGNALTPVYKGDGTLDVSAYPVFSFTGNFGLVFGTGYFGQCLYIKTTGTTAAATIGQDATVAYCKFENTSTSGTKCVTSAAARATVFDCDCYMINTNASSAVVELQSATAAVVDSCRIFAKQSSNAQACISAASTTLILSNLLSGGQFGIILNLVTAGHCPYIRNNTITNWWTYGIYCGAAPSGSGSPTRIIGNHIVAVVRGTNAINSNDAFAYAIKNRVYGLTADIDVTSSEWADLVNQGNIGGAQIGEEFVNGSGGNYELVAHAPSNGANRPANASMGAITPAVVAKAEVRYRLRSIR